MEMVLAGLLEEVVQQPGGRVKWAWQSIGLQEAAHNMMKASNVQFNYIVLVFINDLFPLYYRILNQN